MGFFDFATDPFNQAADSFTTVFTNPGKANLGQWLTALTDPFTLGTTGIIVNDVKHPYDVIGQAAVAGALFGGAEAYGAYGAGSAAPVVGSDVGVSAGAVTDAQAAYFFGGGGASLAGPSAAAEFGSTAAPAAGVLSSIGSAVAGVGEFALKAGPLLLGYAQLAAKKLGVSLPGGSGTQGGGVTVSPSAGPTIGVSIPGAGAGGAAAPIQAGMSPIVIFLILGVAAGMLLLFKGKKK